ncbi:hypothetical protein MHYP_G00076060 [Metynnis hypsauchen]
MAADLEEDDEKKTQLLQNKLTAQHVAMKDKDAASFPALECRGVTKMRLHLWTETPCVSLMTPGFDAPTTRSSQVSRIMTRVESFMAALRHCIRLNCSISSLMPDGAPPGFDAPSMRSSQVSRIMTPRVESFMAALRHCIRLNCSISSLMPDGAPLIYKLGIVISPSWPGSASESPPPRRASGSGWGKGGLGLIAQDAAPATRTSDKQEMMDGWIDGWMDCDF